MASGLARSHRGDGRSSRMEAPRPETRDGRGTSAQPHGGVAAARWGLEPLFGPSVADSRTAPAVWDRDRRHAAQPHRRDRRCRRAGWRDDG